MQDTRHRLHPFRSPHRGVVALDHRGRREQLDERGHQVRFPLVHRDRQCLEHEMIVVTVHDDTRQAVAFAPNQPAQAWIDSTPVPVFHP